MKAPIATATLVFAALGGMFAACTFPDPSFIDDDAGTRSDAIGRTDSAADQDAAQEAMSDVLLSDAFYEGDSSFITVEAGDAEGGVITYNCDKDGDRVFAAGAPCGGLDCNDDNAEILPASNMPFITKPPPPGSSGDWNCDGNVEKQYARFEWSCGGLSNLTCQNLGGFTGRDQDVPCGTTADFITGCTKTPLGLCTVLSTEKRSQGCR